MARHRWQNLSSAFLDHPIRYSLTEWRYFVSAEVIHEPDAGMIGPQGRGVNRRVIAEKWKRGQATFLLTAGCLAGCHVLPGSGGHALATERCRTAPSRWHVAGEEVPLFYLYSDGLRWPGLSDGLRWPGLSDGLRRPGLAGGLRWPGLSDGLRRPGLAGRTFRCGDSVGKPSRWPVQPGFFIISRNFPQFSQFSQFCRWRCQLVVTGAV